MPDTDPIAALRLTDEERRCVEAMRRRHYGGPRVGPEISHDRAPLLEFFDRLDAALSAYRWQPKPDKPGWWWCRGYGITAVHELHDRDGKLMTCMDDGYSVPPSECEWCPVLPPPPREGE